MFKMFFKKKKNSSIFFYNFTGFLQFFGLILLCTGSKSCPETTRPHLTRCDKYFRCTQLPNKTYVWIPAQCDKGLVYEATLKLCVLPGDNWECNLTEEVTIQHITNDDNNVYGVNNIQMGDYSSEEITLDDDNSAFFGDDSREVNDSSELYMETTTPPNSSSNSNSVEDGGEYESSGDGQFPPETKEYIINNNHIRIPESIDFDNRLTSHLQRLTQLIDSIKNQNNTNDPKKELMADQLNHFLDNYNLMTQQNYDGNDTSKLTVPEDGHMHPDHIDEIISQQNKLTIDDVIKQTIKSGIEDVSAFYPIKEPHVNIEFKSNPHPLKKGYRQPDVKIPHSQIIINRPGGSVLFNLDSNNNVDRVSPGTQQRDEPLISEETLKTVLELSKQMVLNQNNNRQVYPIYYTVPIPMLTNEKQTANKRYDEKPPISVTNSFNTYGEDLTRNRPGTINSGNHDGGNNISTTVIFDDHGSTSGWNGNNHNKYNPVHQQSPYGNHYDSEFYQTPTSNSQTFPNYYHPSYTELDSYQPSYYSQFQSENPYKNPSSYYKDPQDLYPPYFTPFYTPDSASTITTPAPTTTTPSTTTENNSREDSDDDVYSDEIVTGAEDVAFPSIGYYDPLASNLGLLQLNEDNQDKLINFGGSFISYNSYKNTLLPLLQPSTLGGGLEILTCSTGIRQPNMTDCSRYYVCNPRTQNVLSYACPPFTAFNKGTKVCDAKSYAICKPEAVLNRYTVAENMRLQQEAQKALAEAQKIRNEAFQNSALASIMQSQNKVRPVSPQVDSHKPTKIIHSNSGGNVPNQKPEPTKKRRIRCYDTGKISDPDSSRNYWVCFRGANGRMKRQKMTCASGLIFCKKTRYCTLYKKC